jgi:hypothetical protein
VSADARCHRPFRYGAAVAIAGLGLALQGPAAAEPRVEPKTEIVPFEAAPFPYSAHSLPGQEKPFFDVEKEGRRGRSTRGGVYWEDTTYADRSVLLHIPRSFDPGRPGLMIVYFHGNQATLERDVRDRQQVPRQVAQSGLNAVLVAPQFAVNALDSTAGNFHAPGAFRRFLEEAAANIARLHGDPRAKSAIEAMPAVIVAYSGGYLPAAYTAHHGGAGDRLRGIILLDALYGETEKFAEWIEARESGFFVSTSSSSTRQENMAFQRQLAGRGIDVDTELPETLTPGSVVFVRSPEGVEHRDFVTNAWVEDPLKAVLGKIAGYPRGPGRRPLTR